jgi:hypothetical protein
LQDGLQNMSWKGLFGIKETDYEKR